MIAPPLQINDATIERIWAVPREVSVSGYLQAMQFLRLSEMVSPKLQLTNYLSIYSS